MSNDLLIKKIAIYSLSSVFVAVSGFISIKVFSIYISPNEFGVYSIMYGIYSIILSIFFSTIGQAALRYYHECKSEDLQGTYYSNIAIITLIISILLFFVAIILSFVRFSIHPSLFFDLTISFVLLMAIQGIHTVLFSIARSMGKALMQLCSDIVFNILKIALFFIFFFNINQSVLSIIYASIISFIIVNLMAFKVIPIKKISLRFFNLPFLIKIIKFSAPLALLPVFNWILSSSDLLIIDLYYSGYEIGIYSMGYKIGSSIFYVFSGVLMLGLYPLITKKHSEDNSRTAKTIKDFSIIYFVVMLPIFTFVLRYSSEIITIFSSETYSESSAILGLASFGFVLLGYISYANKPWELLYKTNRILIYTFISAIVNIALNLIFIPIFGYQAAAITTIISYFFVIVLSLFASRKYMNITIPLLQFIKLFILNVGLYVLFALCDRIMDFHWLINLLLTLFSAGIIYLLTSYSFFRNQIKLLFKTRS